VPPSLAEAIALAVQAAPLALSPWYGLLEVIHGGPYACARHGCPHRAHYCAWIGPCPACGSREVPHYFGDSIECREPGTGRVAWYPRETLRPLTKSAAERLGRAPGDPVWGAAQVRAWERESIRMPWGLFR
jgi:hypothetical protein